MRAVDVDVGVVLNMNMKVKSSLKKQLQGPSMARRVIKKVDTMLLC